MPNRVRVLTVPDSDRTELERRARSKGAPARVVERARIVLLAADGLTGPQIAGRAGCTEPTVVKWRRQYAESGLAGLEDAPRPGGPKTVLTDEVVCEILAATVTPLPPGQARPPQRVLDSVGDGGPAGRAGVHSQRPPLGRMAGAGMGPDKTRAAARSTWAAAKPG
jgi:transposase-like protein